MREPISELPVVLCVSCGQDITGVWQAVDAWLGPLQIDVCDECVRLAILRLIKQETT